jgi:hypothetical protein
MRQYVPPASLKNEGMPERFSQAKFDLKERHRSMVGEEILAEPANAE